MNKSKHLKKLDAIRGCAAVYVAIQHWILGVEFIPESIKTIFFSFGQEAVMVFFLLSGFVICWSCKQTPQLDFRTYSIKRFRRIYFPFCCAILLSIGIFAFNGRLGKTFSWENLLGNLLMLQDISSLKPGTWFRPFLDNLPLWSLTYEWWFYMMFFPVYQILFKKSIRIYIILALSSISLSIYWLYPNQAALIGAYFTIWWSGVEIADIYSRKLRLTFSDVRPILFCLLFMTMLASLPVFATHQFRLGYYPFLMFRHFAFSCVAIAIACFWHRVKPVGFEQTLSLFAVIAPISYGLYIFHYPIFNQLYLDAYIPNFWVANSLKISLVVGLAYLVEVRLQPLVNRWLT